MVSPLLVASQSSRVLFSPSDGLHFPSPPQVSFKFYFEQQNFVYSAQLEVKMQDPDEIQAALVEAEMCEVPSAISARQVVLCQGHL